MSIQGTTRVYALLGHPVRHSLSPALHNQWFRTHGIDGVYVAVPVPVAMANDLGVALRTLGLAGVNLTVPFKTSIVEQLDEVVGLARVGAVNTVVREADGRLVGHNTDGPGFLEGLAEVGVSGLAGATVLVLGAGGAGRAIAGALVGAGARVRWLNRSVHRAEAAREAVLAVWPEAEVRVGPLTVSAFSKWAPKTDLVVQATSSEGAAAIAGLPLERLPSGATWVDINYWDDQPPGWSRLGALGLKRQTGHAMLRRQAARAFALWTGVEPESSPSTPPAG